MTATQPPPEGPSTAHAHLDVRGMACPLPILLAIREIRRLEVGQILEMVGDDPGIREDVPDWCERAGHRLLELREDGRELTSRVEKGSAGRREPARGPE